MDYSIVAYNENKKIFSHWKDSLSVDSENGRLSITAVDYEKPSRSHKNIGSYEDVNIFPTKILNRESASGTGSNVAGKLPNKLYAVVKSDGKYQILRITGEKGRQDNEYTYKIDVIYESDQQVFPLYCGINANLNRLILATLNNDYEWELRLIQDTGTTQKLNSQLIGVLPDQFHFVVNKYLTAQRHIRGHALASYTLFNLGSVNQYGLKINIPNSRMFNLKSSFLSLLYITMPNSNKFFCLNELLGGRDLDADEAFAWTVGIIDERCSEKGNKIISDLNFNREEMRIIEEYNLRKLSLVFLSYQVSDQENARKLNFLVELGTFDFVIPLRSPKDNIFADGELPSKIVKFLKFKIDQIKAQDKSVDQSKNNLTSFSLSK